MIYGYLRVSTGGQTTENQQLAIFKAGYHPDKWYEVSASATVSIQKRQIDTLLDELKAGDTLVVTELSRLGRSVGQIAILVDQLVKKEVNLDCLKEGIGITAQEGRHALNMQTKVMVTMFSLFAEIERDLISQRTKEGIARARANGSKPGRPKGSRRHPLDDRQEEVQGYVNKGLSKTAMAKLLNVSWSQVSHFIKTRGITPKEQ